VLSKVNYTLHTDAIKDFVIPKIDVEQQKLYVYADEADLLNLALWKCTAKQWREANINHAQKGLNIRDVASINELVVLSNMESFNVELLKRGIDKSKRYAYLSEMAQNQLTRLNAIDAEKGFRAIETTPRVKVLNNFKRMAIKNKYSIFQKIRLAYFLMRTKLLCRRARIIRFPFEIRGKEYIDLGTDLTTGVGCRLEAFSETGEKTMHFGNNVQINDYVHICSMQNVTIGNNVLIAGKVYISDNSHGSYKGDEFDTSPEIEPIKRAYYKNPVVIEDNVWIGEGVVILPGVTLGKGCIVGANSVVSKSIPPNVIAVGTPAKPIKRFNFEIQKWAKI
jgi:acetyltransferase-like isoleucine patch superfamily enzyme